MHHVMSNNYGQVTSASDSDETDVYKDLSSHLYRVLDVVGVSEEMREGYREKAVIFEILSTVVRKVKRDDTFTWYNFGSKYEGTTTRGLQSDTDMVACNESLPVVENIEDEPDDGIALLILSDETKPGYVKLQSLINRTLQTINEREVIDDIEKSDHQGRILVKYYYLTEPNVVRHGPADTLPADEGKDERDMVYAYRCRTVPTFADDWLSRSRPNQWPSQEQLQRMGTCGCFFVGVAHPESRNEEIEWRISFSLQERDLMSSLNPTQHKCYVLLKMIKKDIIQPRVGKSLSSYHCKTCIFHLSERHGVTQWTPNNLVPCILDCLRLLLVWVRQENCPNYFIKGENMFDKLDKSTLHRLSVLLQELLSSGVQFLYEIKCDDVGMLLTMSKSDRRLEEMQLKLEKYYGYKICNNTMRNLLDLRVRVYNVLDESSTPSERVSRANDILQYLEHTTNITEHKLKDVRMVLDRSIPYIRFVIVQMKCSNRLLQIKWETDYGELQSLARELHLCYPCDLISSRLLVASLFLQCDNLDSCQEFLQDCETRLKPYVTSLCSCSDYQRYKNTPLEEKVVAENLSFEEFRTECIAACMIFLPPEANLVPAALQYEMYRSVYTPPGSRNEYDDFWFDWIVVDSKVYLYLLQYIVHTKTNSPVLKQDAVDNLQLLNDDVYENLGHKETTLNLLGWIYMQENRVQDAFVCFRRSLAIRPLHNAAKWHLLMLIHSNFDTETIYDRKWFQ